MCKSPFTVGIVLRASYARYPFVGVALRASYISYSHFCRCQELCEVEIETRYPKP